MISAPHKAPGKPGKDSLRSKDKSMTKTACFRSAFTKNNTKVCAASQLTKTTTVGYNKARKTPVGKLPGEAKKTKIF